MPCLRVGNSYFHLHTRLNRNGGNLLNNIWGAKQVDNTLVDTKFKSIPSVGTFTTRGLPGGDVQNLGGDSHWALNPQHLILGAANQISTNLSMFLTFFEV